MLDGICWWDRASAVPGEGVEEGNCYHNSNHHHHLSTYVCQAPPSMCEHLPRDYGFPSQLGTRKLREIRDMS